MKKVSFTLLSLLFVAATISSCVPGRKYNRLKDTSRIYMTERDALKSENIILSMSNRELEAKLASIGTDLEEAAKGKEAINRDLAKMREEYVKLNTKYTDLQNAQDELIRGNVRESRKLLAELQSAQANLQMKEDMLRDLERGMDEKKSALDELTFELDKRNSRLRELEQILDAQQKAVRDLKSKVSEALFGFENNGLTVTTRNGKVYVSLDEKLLFKTGSYEIDANGRNALRRLAGVLEKAQDIQVTIEGHTDDVPYRQGSGQLQDNWDLSVKRATTVVRVLIEGTKIDPKRLTASGRSEYMPVEAGKSVESRSKNRRTEIILTPDLSELYNIIEKY